MRRINQDTCTPIPKPGKAKRRKVDPLHREATKLAAESDCPLCGASRFFFRADYDESDVPNG